MKIRIHERELKECQLSRHVAKYKGNPRSQKLGYREGKRQPFHADRDGSDIHYQSEDADQDEQDGFHAFLREQSPTAEYIANRQDVVGERTDDE